MTFFLKPIEKVKKGSKGKIFFGIYYGHSDKGAIFAQEYERLSTDGENPFFFTFDDV